MPFVKAKSYQAAQSLAAKVVQRRWRERQARRVTVPVVKAVVKQQIQKQAEAKSNYQAWASLNYDNLVTSVNPFYPLSQGSTAETMIGEKIHVKNLRVNGFMYNAIPSATSNDCMVRMFLIHARDKLHSGSQSNITPADIFRSGGSGFRTVDSLDYHKIKVLKEVKMTIRYNANSQLIHRPFSFTYNFNKNETFDADSSGYLKNGQYFFCIITYDGRGTGANYWGAKFNTSLNYTDI